ncbi:hypothetical protein CPC08DRAFT_639403 [Agrocybe pediades]|nr:hypothetical protein CPC08DRAFT_639403 [Agrocybe pediades]
MSTTPEQQQFNPSVSANYGFTFPARPSLYMRGYIKYMDAIYSWDVERILDCFDEELEHRILPGSLNRPVLNKRQYRDYLNGVLPLFRICKMDLHEIIEVQERMTVHMTVRGRGTSGASYANETTQIIHWKLPPPSSDPHALPKIRLMKEFVDSLFASTFFSNERALAKEKAQQARERLSLSSRSSFSRRS